MQPSTKPLPSLEERLAKLAASVLGGSLVVVGVLLAFAITITNRSIWAVVAVACLAIYAGQLYYLRSLRNYMPKQRLRIWQLSLLGHVPLFGAVLWVTGAPSLTAVLLLPEAASAAIHLLTIYHVIKGPQVA